MKLVDVHGHLGAWTSPVGGGVEPLIAMVRKWNIERCILSAARALLVDLKTGNRELEAAVEQHDELLGYVYIDPTHPDESVAEIERYAGHPKFVGVKSRPEYHDLKLDAPEYRPALEAAAAHRMPALIHYWHPRPPSEHMALADELDLPIILAHVGGESWKICAEAVTDCPNIYLDYACSRADAGKIEHGLAHVGADRILLGTDLMLIHPAWTIGMYESAEITDADRRKIFRTNAIRLFNLDLPPDEGTGT